MKKETKKGTLLTLVLVLVFIAVVIVVAYSILHKPARPVLDPDEYTIIYPGENDNPDPNEQGGDDTGDVYEEEHYTFGTTADGDYLFPPDEYTLMDGPAVTLTHRIAGGYDVWEGTDPDGEQIMLVYKETGKRDFQYVRGSTQSGVGDFNGFDTWEATGETVMRVYDKWRDGLVAVPASVSEDGKTMTLHVPDIWRAGNGR